MEVYIKYIYIYMDMLIAGKSIYIGRCRYMYSFTYLNTYGYTYLYAFMLLIDIWSMNYKKVKLLG